MPVDGRVFGRLAFLRQAAARRTDGTHAVGQATEKEKRGNGVEIDPSNGAHILGSDGVFEFDLPAGAVTAADVVAAAGSVSLVVRRVLLASGGSAGGRGHYSFGRYLVQLLDANGRPGQASIGWQRRSTELQPSRGLEDCLVPMQRAGHSH